MPERQGEANSRAHAGAEIAHGDIAFDGPHVGEDHPAERIAGQREADFRRAGEQEIAADAILRGPGARADSAK